ncbi:TPA: AAA family ATPase [Vibrio parahaemolyticus]|nr:AAA family ATPase [Vibrio parahaemolyticus]
MIKKFKLAGFKRFESNEFELKNITLLTGMNGAGKSSLIQGLLLAKQASLSEGTVPLDSSYGVDLGTASSVLNWNSDELISIGVNNDCNWQFTLPSEDALYLSISDATQATLPSALTKKTRNFTYLCAERLGPRVSYPLFSASSETLELGIHGENTTQLIEAFGNAPIEDQMRVHPLTLDSEPKFLTYQIEKWLSEIVRPIEIKVETSPVVKSAVLNFRTPKGDWVQATNMGFGVSYALPIILAGLLVPRGSLLIVENPEAHLHPAGQSRMGVFMGWLASKGVQIIAETHSDHFLNGVRRAIAEHQYINSSDANVLFFDTDSENGIFSHLEFSSDGSNKGWPRHFFDQYQLDTAALGRIRRSTLRDVVRN